MNTSSAAVYGDPQRLPIRESDPTVPISPYGVGKLAAERYVAVFSQLYGITASSVRLFSVYGPRQRKQVVYDLIDRLAGDPSRLEVIGDGTQERDFAFVEDVAAAMVHVGTGARDRARSSTWRRAPATPSRSSSLLYVRRWGSIPRSRTPGASVRATPSAGPSTRPRSTALGFTAGTSLVEGLRATWDWYRAERGLRRRCGSRSTTS